MKQQRDAVDDFIDQWRRERPDLKPEVMGIFGRMGRVWAHSLRAIEATLGRWNLQFGEFDVLATMRRSGPPFVVAPSQLTRSMMLSPSGMTSRLDRLEKLGYVERRANPDDRRGLLVVLTEAGRSLVDEVVTAHVANETKLLSTLTAAERKALEAVLRTLLRSFESAERTK